jgi:hypothetical protein
VGFQDGGRKTCWVSWENMTKPKFLGALGFRDIELVNIALLSREVWRLIQSPHTLSARVLKAVYFPDLEFLRAELGSHPSQIWQAILDGREVLKPGLIRRVGTGEDTHAWDDNWIPREVMLRPIACLK